MGAEGCPESSCSRCVPSTMWCACSLPGWNGRPDLVLYQPVLGFAVGIFLAVGASSPPTCLSSFRKCSPRPTLLAAASRTHALPVAKRPVHHRCPLYPLLPRSIVGDLSLYPRGGSVSGVRGLVEGLRCHGDSLSRSYFRVRPISPLQLHHRLGARQSRKEQVAVSRQEVLALTKALEVWSRLRPVSLGESGQVL